MESLGVGWRKTACNVNGDVWGTKNVEYKHHRCPVAIQRYVSVTKGKVYFQQLMRTGETKATYDVTDFNFFCGIWLVF